MLNPENPLLCPETPPRGWVAESDESLIPTPKRPCSPSYDSKPSDHGQHTSSLSPRASPTPLPSPLSHGASAIIWTLTWSGFIGVQSHTLSISGETVSSAGVRTSRITGCSSTLSDSQRHEYGAMILDELVQSCASSFEHCPVDEWRWCWQH